MGWPADSSSSSTGSNVLAVRTVTASGPVLLTDATVLVNTAAGNITMPLPSPASCKGERFTFKKISADANSFALNGATIEGAANVQVMAQYEAVSIVSDGAAFFVLYRG